MLGANGSDELALALVEVKGQGVVEALHDGHDELSVFRGVGERLFDRSVVLRGLEFLAAQSFGIERNGPVGAGGGVVARAAFVVVLGGHESSVVFLDGVADFDFEAVHESEVFGEVPVEENLGEDFVHQSGDVFFGGREASVRQFGRLVDVGFGSCLQLLQCH